MNRGLRVGTPPPKPLLVFDGDCHFCAIWVHRGRQITGEAVDYIPAQDARVAAQYPEIPREQFDQAVQLIATDGMVYSGAEAVFRTLDGNPRWRWPLRVYESSRPLARFAERAYRFVAEHRPGFSTLIRWCRGLQVEGPSHFLARWLFLRGLGACYLFAFLSLGMQIKGLIGHDGILPVDQFMPAVKQQCDEHGFGLDRYRLVPTFCWFNTSNAFLEFQCAAGTGLAVCLIAGLAPAPVLFLLWLLYLSLVSVGRDFLGFQWDNLLLEAGLLAVFFAPWQWVPSLARETPPSRVALWLLRLLLFKLMFLSGCVKLLSGDPTWRGLTALTFHYETQPLPTWIGWYAAQLPVGFQKLSCAVVLAVEVGAPFLFFAPRRIRFFGGALVAGLEVLILLTGNYTFFNWLTLALCLLLWDDLALARMIPGRWGGRPALGHSASRNLTQRSRRLGGGIFGRHAVFREGAENSVRGGRAPQAILEFGPNTQPSLPGRFRGWPRPVVLAVAAIWLSASSFLVVESFGSRWPWLAPGGWVAEKLEPLRSINSYGLFAVMTTQRNEIVVEGSNDGVNWRPYAFKYKPGDLNRRPDFVAPFQPRLDWQMWFAALGSAPENPWFGAFCERLLQGSPGVLALLAANPFPGRPPRYLRAELYTYHFTTLATHRATGDWWQRTPAGEYLAPVSLGE